MSPKCLASMEGIRSETVNKQLAVAILYMTVKFRPRTSAVTSPTIQTTINNQHQNMRTESMTPMSLFYLPWFSRPKLITNISCCPPPASDCNAPTAAFLSEAFSGACSTPLHTHSNLHPKSRGDLLEEYSKFLLPPQWDSPQRHSTLSQRVPCRIKLPSPTVTCTGFLPSPVLPHPCPPLLGFLESPRAPKSSTRGSFLGNPK